MPKTKTTENTRQINDNSTFHFTSEEPVRPFEDLLYSQDINESQALMVLWTKGHYDTVCASKDSNTRWKDLQLLCSKINGGVIVESPHVPISFLQDILMKLCKDEVHYIRLVNAGIKEVSNPPTPSHPQSMLDWYITQVSLMEVRDDAGNYLLPEGVEAKYLKDERINHDMIPNN